MGEVYLYREEGRVVSISYCFLINLDPWSDAEWCPRLGDGVLQSSHAPVALILLQVGAFSPDPRGHHRVARK